MRVRRKFCSLFLCKNINGNTERVLMEGKMMYQYQQPQRYDIIHVNGEPGAQALQMFPNSKALVLDDTAPLVWLCQTDGAGYKTVSAYKIEPYVPDPPLNVNDIMARLDRLEGMLNDKPNTTSPKRKQSESAE